MKTKIRAAMAALLVGLAYPVAAKQVNWVFTGTMAMWGTHDPSGWLQGAFAPGQEFSVTLQFDTDDGTYTTPPWALEAFQTSKLAITASSGGQTLSSYSNLAAPCASIYSGPDCGVLEMSAFAGSNSASGDSLRYNQRGPLQFGSEQSPFPGAVTGHMSLAFDDYTGTAFTSGASLTSIPDLTKFRGSFSFVVYSPVANAGTPEQPVSGWGLITTVTSPVPEPSTFGLWSLGLAGVLVSRRIACRSPNIHKLAAK